MDTATVDAILFNISKDVEDFKTTLSDHLEASDFCYLTEVIATLLKTVKDLRPKINPTITHTF